MEDRLVLGLPDAKDAIAPRRRFEVEEKGARLNVFGVFPLFIATIAAMIHEMFAEDEPRPAPGGSPFPDQVVPSPPASEAPPFGPAPTAGGGSGGRSLAQLAQFNPSPMTPLELGSLSFQRTRFAEAAPLRFRPVSAETANDNGGSRTVPNARLDPLAAGGVGQPPSGGGGSGAAPDTDEELPDLEDPDDGETIDPPPTGRTNRRPVLSGPVQLNDATTNIAVVISMAELLSGASDPDGDTLVVRFLQASSGQLQRIGLDRWLFTPAPGDTSAVTFTYKVSDGTELVTQTALLDLKPAHGASIEGTEGDDLLVGTPLDDVIDAKGGDDIVYGRESRDVIAGGSGNDRLIGGAGDDVLWGNAGDDILFGGLGDDTLFGEDGDDILHGEEGDDILVGGAGRDRLFGGTGNDHLDGSEGDDTLSGEAGKDVLDGGEGDDAMSGGEGDDAMVGSAGRDRMAGDGGADRMAGGEGDDDLEGGEGDDTLDGGAGNDEVDGGEGDDVATGGEGDDRVTGAAGDDTLDGGAGNDEVDGGEGDDVATGGDGDDRVTGAAGDDTLDGGAGNDEIDGGEGDDVATGGAGDDRVTGAAGDDTLDGGAGNDEIDGGEGDDVATGGAGDDRVIGGAGDDTLRGGAGNDQLYGGEGDDVLLDGEGLDRLEGGAGDDVIQIEVDGEADMAVGGAGADTLDLSRIVFDADIDLPDGWVMIGGQEEVRLFEIENVRGGSGNDRLVADDDVNILVGGAGNDMFVFRSLDALQNRGGPRDHILDFQPGDRIDLSQVKGEDDFAAQKLFFAGAASASASEIGALTVEHRLVDDAEITVVKGDLGPSEDDHFEIVLEGRHALTEQDFLLAARHMDQTT